MSEDSSIQTGEMSPKKSRLASVSVVLCLMGFASVFTLPFISLLPPRFELATFPLGILSLMVMLVSFPLAVVLGLVAVVQIGRSHDQITGRGRAVSGLITGFVGLLLEVAMLLPAIHGAREKARLVQCMSNVKQIGLAIGLYANEHDGNIPRTFADLQPYATNLNQLLICPSAKDTSHPSYQITFGGGKWERWNTNDSEIDAIVVTESTNNHRFGYHVLYNDGHVQFNDNGRYP